jgi:putative Mg2+ transporter-C (MgtC) family protein
MILFADVLRAVVDEFTDQSTADMVVLVIRLVVAGAIGALYGWERERSGKAAGLRTHILVAVGSAGVVAVCQLSGFPPDAVSRVLQGLITGIGFIGGGCILKSEGHVTGLTTAAGIWLIAAVGVTAGLGRPVAALLIGLLGWFILSVLGRWEAWLTRTTPPRNEG